MNTNYVNAYQYGLWPFVIINTLVALLFVFSFFRPKSAVDWSAFGGFSAFLIALFTEMYGFPLTLFLLAPWLQSHFPGINPFAHNTGMLWNIIFNIKPRDPMMSWLHFLSLLIIFVGILLITEAWATLYAAHKEQKLATTGLYRYARHPQYDGFFLIMIGYIVMWPTILTLFMFPVLIWVYRGLARKEEVLVKKEFGASYEEYKIQTPAFVPRLHFIKQKVVTMPIRKRS